jgi:ATP-dependent helicase IRC3
VDRLLFPIATGLGKTVIFSQLPQQFPELSASGTLVLVHRDILVQQAAAAFATANPLLRIGVEQAEKSVEPKDADIVIASVQTLSRRERLLKYEGFGGIIIVDEAHHAKAGNTYDTVLSFFGLGSDPSLSGNAQSDRRLLAGFTATPFRTDGAALMGSFFEKCVSPLDLGWGVCNGYLVDIEVIRVLTAVTVDLEKEERHEIELAAASVPAAAASVPAAAAAAPPSPPLPPPGTGTAAAAAEHGAEAEEWSTSERVATFKRAKRTFGTSYGAGQEGGVAAAVDTDRRNAIAVKAILTHGRSHVLVFCASVRHAHRLAELLALEAGVAGGRSVWVRAIDATIEGDERTQMLQEFRSETPLTGPGAGEAAEWGKERLTDGRGKESAGVLRVLTNFGVLTEGFDAPECDTVVMCRPTASRLLYMQMLGRGTRPHPETCWPVEGHEDQEWGGGRAGAAGGAAGDPGGGTGGRAVWRGGAGGAGAGGAEGAAAGWEREDQLAASRREAIMQSPKPSVRIVDLVDVCGEHRNLDEHFVGNKGTLYKITGGATGSGAEPSVETEALRAAIAAAGADGFDRCSALPSGYVSGADDGHGHGQATMGSLLGLHPLFDFGAGDHATAVAAAGASVSITAPMREVQQLQRLAPTMFSDDNAEAAAAVRRCVSLRRLRLLIERYMLIKHRLSKHRLSGQRQHAITNKSQGEGRGGRDMARHRLQGALKWLRAGDKFGRRLTDKEEARGCVSYGSLLVEIVSVGVETHEKEHRHCDWEQGSGQERVQHEHEQQQQEEEEQEESREYLDGDYGCVDDDFFGDYPHSTQREQQRKSGLLLQKQKRKRRLQRQAQTANSHSELTGTRQQRTRLAVRMRTVVEIDRPDVLNADGDGGGTSDFEQLDEVFRDLELCWRPSSYAAVSGVLGLESTSDLDQPVIGFSQGGERYWLQARVRSVQSPEVASEQLGADLRPRELVVERCKLQRAACGGNPTKRP